MPTCKEYLEHWKKRYKLKIINASIDLKDGLNVKFELDNTHIAILSRYCKLDYERFKVQSELFAKSQLPPTAFPQLKKCHVLNDVLLLSGSPIVINVFLELLFNPSASE